MVAVGRDREQRTADVRARELHDVVDPAHGEGLAAAVADEGVALDGREDIKQATRRAGRWVLEELGVEDSPGTP